MTLRVLADPKQAENRLQTAAEAGMSIQRKMIDLLLSLLTKEQTEQFATAILEFPELSGDNRARIENLRIESASAAVTTVSHPLSHHTDTTPTLAYQSGSADLLNAQFTHTDLLQHQADHSSTQAPNLTDRSTSHSVPTPTPLDASAPNTRIRTAGSTPIDPVETKKLKSDNGELSDNLDALFLESAGGLAGFAGSQAGRLQQGQGTFERAASAPVAVGGDAGQEGGDRLRDSGFHEMMVEGFEHADRKELAEGEADVQGGGDTGAASGVGAGQHWSEQFESTEMESMDAHAGASGEDGGGGGGG